MDLIDGKWSLALKSLADNLFPPTAFCMLVHIACWIAISFIKIMSYNTSLSPLPFAKWGSTLELVASATCNYNYGMRMGKTIYGQSPILHHPFFKIYRQVTVFLCQYKCLPSSSSESSSGLMFPSVSESGLLCSLSLSPSHWLSHWMTGRL